MKKYEYEAYGIKSKEGKRIFDAAIAQAVNLDKQIAKAVTKNERDRLDEKRLKVINEAAARAVLHNPPDKPKKKAGLPGFKSRLRRIKFS